MIDCRIDHDHSHPSHQYHFKIFDIAELKFFKIPEHFHKAVIHHINSFVVMINIAEYSFETVSIILLVEEFLVPLVISYTAGYESLQFQSG